MLPQVEFDQVLSKVQGFFHSEGKFRGVPLKRQPVLSLRGLRQLVPDWRFGAGATKLLDEQQRDRSSSDSGSLNPDNAKVRVICTTVWRGTGGEAHGASA